MPIASALIAILCLIGASGTATGTAIAGKKVLYINSYHRGYPGSDPIAEKIEEVLHTQGIEVRSFYMDSKRNPDPAFIEQAALEAKALIEQLSPDVVITSDDNAAKSVIVPYYKNAALPFVFCGVNWDASTYGFPYRNVTGMVEVALVSEILRHLRNYASGERIGFLGGDRISERKNHEYYQKRFGVGFEKSYFAKTFEQWKRYFLQLQVEADLLMLTSHAGIVGWDDEQARQYVERHIKIPVGTEHEWEMPLALVGVTKDFAEMGTWAAHAAMRILEGVPPERIPITANKRGHLLFNRRLAKVLGIEDEPLLATIVE